jgi:hypothetical protein
MVIIFKFLESLSSFSSPNKADQDYSKRAIKRKMP